MNLLANKPGKILLVTALYLSEGAPIGFIWWAMPTLLRQEQVAVEGITSLVSLLVLPWVFKFLWAPLVDSLRSKRIGFRHWIMGAQTFMGLSLIPLLFISPVENFGFWSALLFFHSFAAATQDVAIDALVINVVKETERGMLNGFMQAGMLAGRSLFGGGTLVIASMLGLNGVLILLIVAIYATLFLLFFVTEPEYESKKKERLEIFWNNLLSSFSLKNTWLGIGFALIGAAAFETAGALAGPFLVDKGVDDETIGWFFGVLVVGSMLLGGLVGGIISDKVSRKLSIGTFLTGFVVVIFALAATDAYYTVSPSFYLMLFTLMYLFVGLFTASSYALFMDITNPKIGGTQFSTYMAATNGCESWSVWAAGKVVASSGYAAAFAVMSAVSLGGLALLKRIRTKSKEK